MSSGHDDDYRFYPAPQRASDYFLDGIAVIGAMLILVSVIVSATA